MKFVSATCGPVLTRLALSRLALPRERHDGARLPPKWAVSAWVTFFQDGGFKRAKACGYIGEEILGLAG